MKRKTTLMSVLFALIAFVANAGSGIYLRGEVNGWLDSATDELMTQWEFQETADPNVFILTDKVLPAGEFKIGDADWTNVDFGGIGSAVVPGVGHGLVERSSSNLHLLGDATCSEIRFDKANRELLLTLAGEDKNYKIDFVDEAATDLNFTRMGDAMFVLSGETKLSGEFCIKSLDDAVVYGSNSENLDYGEYFLAKDGANFNLTSTMECSGITLTETADGATLKILSNGLIKELYFRGDVNKWEAVDEWKFEYVGNGVYRLTDKVLPAGTFKIADADWSVGCNYGGPTDGSWDVVSGESLILENKSAYTEPSNLNLLSDVSCSQILFDIKTGTLLINFPECVYVFGDNTGWKWIEENSKLAETGNEGEYQGILNLSGPNGEALCFWQIYDKLNYLYGYAWGLVENAEAGTLFKGCTGFVVTDAGWYIVTVNLKTGEFTLEPTGDPSSVADVEAADVKVIGGAGEIRVEGAAEDVKVFALSGALLSEGETIVKVPAGIYLVSVGSKVVKVAVK